MSTIDIKTGVDEKEQESCFQNACLHSVKDHAVSTAMYLPPEYGNLSEAQIKAKLERDLKPLLALGYSFVIAIGPEHSDE